MSCCSGGCCWWKKPDTSPPSTHPPPPIHSPPDPSVSSTNPPISPPPLIHPTDPSNPSTHLLLTTSCCNGGCCWWKKPDTSPPSTHPPSPIHSPPDPSVPSTNPPISPPQLVHPTDPSNPSTHPVESGEKPSSLKLREVLKSFKEVDIGKADDFIKAVNEMLNGGTAQKNAQDTPSTSSSSTNKLSILASFSQGGATFLKFVGDHTQKIQTTGDFFKSGDAKRIVGDVLQEIGQVHWAVAGLSIVGYLLSKYQEVSENRSGCVDIIKGMLKLASYIKHLNDLSLVDEHREVLNNAFQYIVQGSILCHAQLDSGGIFSFLKSSINSDTLSSIRSNIDKIYQDLQVITGIEALDQQQKMSAQQKEILAHQKEMLAQQPIVLPLSQPSYPKNAVGIEEQLATVMNLLKTEKSEDCSSSAVVIWGFGGIGKTTLAQAVVSTVDRESYNYSRIELDEVCEKNYYIVIQQQILKDAFPSYQGGREIKLRDDSDGRDNLTEAFKSETNKPVFLFIDNALHKKDLEKILPEDLSGLPQRSRILITTRILKVTDMLEERGLQRKDYPVKTLSDNHAVEILCKDPKIRDGIKDDLEKLVKVCNGIPLVLKIVAARLSKQNYNANHCTQIVGALQRGEKIKEDELSKRLFEFVYNELESSTQEAFLDICCFFDKGFRCQSAKYIVGAEQVTSLQEAALITIVMGKPLHLWRQRQRRRLMQRPFRQPLLRLVLSELQRLEQEEEEEERQLLLQWLGLVLQLQLEEEEEVLSIHDIILSIGRSLSKPSRIMDSNSWREAEKDEAKLRETEGVSLDESCKLEKRHLDLMKDTLRILNWRGSIDVSATDAVTLPELRYISTPDDASWLNVEALDKLAVLKCKKLPTKQRDPLQLPESLREISAFEQPDEMQDLLKTVPNSALEELHLCFSGTSESFNEKQDNSENAFNRFLEGLNKLKILSVRNCNSLCELPQQVCRLLQLRRLRTISCSKIQRLPELFGELKTLIHLDLTDCSSLKELPHTFGQLETLEKLDLSGCSSLEKLPCRFEQLRSLQNLDLRSCISLQELPEFFGQLKTLTHLDLTDCQSLKELPHTFGQLETLEKLELNGCSSLEKLPRGFEQLRSLQNLDLSGCEKLESDICLMDDNIKIVQKSDHFCTDCWENKKLKIYQ